MRAQFVQLKNTGAAMTVTVTVLLTVIIAGIAAAHLMDAHGHHITGMTNRVVWGIPHVFALTLILGASGALNVASLASVFSVAAYKTQTRLSALLAIALLIGGLLILTLDLGRPDRLAIALTHYNFQSVFAWNIFLYGGLITVSIIYLWCEFERRYQHHARTVGIVAFVWRFILTGGSGAIFALLIARPAYHAALVIPLFIALSLSTGTAMFILVVAMLSRWQKNNSPMVTVTLIALARLLGWFVVVTVILTVTLHLTNFYSAEKRALEIFLLRDGGIFPALTWLVQLILGGIVPIVLLLTPRCRASARARLVAAGTVIIGVFAQLYVFIIGGQIFPVALFPGSTVTGGALDDIASYAPSSPEWLLGFGGVAVALLIVLVTVRVLPFLPREKT